MSGSSSQMTMLSTSGYTTKDPAVTPAPNPTVSMDRGLMWMSPGMCPIILSRRISRGAVDASALPLTKNCRWPALSAISNDEFIPSPLYRTVVGWSLSKSNARTIGAMRRPYAMTGHGTSETVHARAAASTMATAAIAAARTGRKRGTRWRDAPATSAAATERPIKIC